MEPYSEKTAIGGSLEKIA